MAKGLGSLPANQSGAPQTNGKQANLTVPGSSGLTGLASFTPPPAPVTPNPYSGAPGGPHTPSLPVINNPYAGAPGGRNNPANFKPPVTVPKPTPVDPYQQYKQTVFDNLKYLTAKERATTLARQGQLDKVYSQQQADVANINKLVQGASKGDANAAKALQARLNQAGYKVSVDGVVGQQTVKALEAFSSVQNAKYAAQLGHLAGWASPMTARAEANKAIPAAVQSKQRGWILSRSINQLATLDAALAHAQADAKNGNTGADKKVADIQQAINAWRSLQQKAKDPVNGFDAVTLNDVFTKVAQAQVHEGEAQVQNILEHNTFMGALGQLAAETLDPNTNLVTHILNDAYNQSQTAWAAAFEASGHNHGAGGFFESVQAFFGGLTSWVRVPGTSISLGGLIAPAGSDARKWIVATNTADERQALTNAGELLSPGQTATGRVTPQFAEKHGIIDNAALSYIPGITKHAGKGEVVKGFDPVSGAVDLAWQVATDPATYVSAFAEPLANFGEHWGVQALKNATTDQVERYGEAFIQQTGRLIGLDSTAIGRSFQNVVSDAVSDVSKVSAYSLAKSLPGLDIKIAEDALTRGAQVAAEHGSEAGARAAQQEILQAFVRGAYQPTTGAFKAATAFIGERLGLFGEGGIGAEVNLGRKVARLSDRVGWVRQFARARGDVASVLEGNATTFIDKSLDSAARAGKSTLDEMWTHLVGNDVRGISIQDRFWNLVDQVGELKNPQLQAAFEGDLRKFFINAESLKNVPLGSFMDLAFVQDGMEEALRKFEVAAALAKGDNFTSRVAGEAVSDFRANLSRGFLVTDEQVRNAVSTAAENLGQRLGAPVKKAKVKDIRAGIAALPEDIQKNLDARLEAVLAKGKKGLGRLAADVKALDGNGALQEELSRLLEQQQGRIEQIGAETGHATAGLGQKAARAVLSVTDLQPPREAPFQRSVNESVNKELRAETGHRVMDAMYLPEHVQQGFLRDLEQAPTEGEHFKVYERIYTAALEAKGLTRDEANKVLSMARDGGTFTLKQAKKPVFGTLPGGETVEDIQLLSQRLETVRLPSPQEVAAYVRQAIVDGAVDANAAQRIGARLRTFVHGIGDIGIEYADGARKLTLRMPVKKAFEMWKVLVVTNMGMPIVGATAGFLYGGDTLSDRIKGMGIGFGVGSIGMLRFVTRTAGIDDHLRMFFGDTELPAWLKPGWTKQAKSRLAAIEGDVFRRSQSGDLTRIGNFGTDHFANDLLIHVDPDWVALDQKHARFLDGYFRVVNHQVKPETDEVMATILREKAGHFDGQTVNITRVVRLNEGAVTPEMEAAGLGQAKVLETPPVGEPSTQGFDLWKEAFGGDTVPQGEDPYAALKAAAGEASGAEVPLTNEQLLQQFPDAETKTYFRGVAPGNEEAPLNWTPREDMARDFAGPEGRVFRVEVPVDSEGVPLVGHSEEGLKYGPGAEAQAHILPPEWAAAADEAAPNGFARTEADAALYTTKSITVTVPVKSREIADRDIAAFLKTDQGQVWLKRWREVIGFKGSDEKVAKEAVKRMRGFVDRYFTPEMANIRVAGGLNGVPSEIGRDTLQRALDDNLLADTVHSQQMWKMPRNSRELFRTVKDIPRQVRQGIMSTPSNTLNRGPWHTRIFERQYDRLIAQGVEGSEAQRIADAFATRQVRQTLHYYNDLSRFAAAVDPFMPFTHAKEDIVRVWSRFIVNHPLRILAVGRYAALAFNNGKENGTFTKNPFTGAYEVSIPGLGAVASKIFGLGAEMGFGTNITDILFSGVQGYGPAGGLVDSFLPRPGGPYWALFSAELRKHAPEVFTGDNPITNWMWNYGPGGDLLRADTSRLWMAFTGDTPPWEIGNQDHWQNQLNRWRVEVAQELMYHHNITNPGDEGWVPTDQQVDEATKNFFLAWAFYNSSVPGTSHVTLAGPEAYWSARNAFTLGGILEFNPQKFLEQYPQFAPYSVGSTSTYVGPQDLASLRGFDVGGSNGLMSYDPNTDQWVPNTKAGKEHQKKALESTSVGFKQYKTLGEFKQLFEQYRRTGEYFKALDNASHWPNPIDREREIVALNHQYADVVARESRTRHIKEDIYTVLFKYPKGQIQNDALARIKAQYHLTNSDMAYWTKQARNPLYQPNPWADSRQGIEVDAAVREALGSKVSDISAVQAYVSTLSPAEQLRYWQYQKLTTGFAPGLDDPNAVMNRYNFYKNQENTVAIQYPWLFRSNATWTNPWAAAMSAKLNANYENEQKAWDAIDRLNIAIDYAKQTSNWTQWKALRNQRDSYYNMIDALHNQYFENTPNLTKYYEDLHAASIELQAGNESAAKAFMAQAEADKANAGFFLIPEEQRFLNMPVPVQQAYMASLIEDLNMPPTDSKFDPSLRQYIKDNTGLKKSYWEWLSPLQQRILAANFPQYVDKWKSDSNYYLHGDGAVKLGYKVPPDLQHAYDILDQYDKRSGMKKPAAYQAYLDLPANSQVRHQFLQAHPEVQAYINAGPFKHMPKHLRDQVAAILAKYGKWHSSGVGGGNGGSIRDRGFGRQGNLSVQWALSMLHTWNRRGSNSKPSSYDQWVAMPSGETKAQFLQDHPEIGNWLRLGPMSSMPEMFKEVVRSIMVQYGLWTQRDDPLAQTITGYFNTPGYAKQQYLDQHPELSAYWAETRTPDQQAMFDLQNQYFAIQDVGAKQAFLAAHPELQQHFVEARTKRYEQFLNQVAVYMGANPSMFTEYLNRQQDVLAELLRKFATPSLLREVAPQVSTQTAGESGRQRGARARAAA